MVGDKIIRYSFLKAFFLRGSILLNAALSTMNRHTAFKLSYSVKIILNSWCCFLRCDFVAVMVCEYDYKKPTTSRTSKRNSQRRGV